VSREGQDAAAKGDKAKEQDATAGQPHAALPPCWRKNLANGAHHKHGREGPQSE